MEVVFDLYFDDLALLRPGGSFFSSLVPRLPWSELSVWCEDHGYTDDLKLRVMRWLMAIDDAVVQALNKPKKQ